MGVINHHSPNPTNHVIKRCIRNQHSTFRKFPTVCFHLEQMQYIWVRSRRCGCLITWFCYQMIAKPACSVQHYWKRQSLHYWPLMRGIHWSSVDSPHKGPVMWKAALRHDAIMCVSRSYDHQWFHTIFIAEITSFRMPSEILRFVEGKQHIRTLSQHKTNFFMYEHSHPWLRDRLIWSMGIHLLVRRYLYIETAPRIFSITNETSFPK